MTTATFVRDLSDGLIDASQYLYRLSEPIAYEAIRECTACGGAGVLWELIGELGGWDHPRAKALLSDVHRYPLETGMLAVCWGWTLDATRPEDRVGRLMVVETVNLETFAGYATRTGDGMRIVRFNGETVDLARQDIVYANVMREPTMRYGYACDVCKGVHETGREARECAGIDNEEYLRECAAEQRARTNAVKGFLEVPRAEVEELEDWLLWARGGEHLLRMVRAWQGKPTD